MNWKQHIMGSKNLDELCERLNVYELACMEANAKLDPTIDFTSLPIFAPETNNPEGVFSFDETRQMIPGYEYDWIIEPRWDTKSNNVLN